MGKSRNDGQCSPIRQKHPHARGEVSSGNHRLDDGGETPPRTWGSLKAGQSVRLLDRNTPTHMGKSCQLRYAHTGIWKHPHARGEVEICLPRELYALETPPRTWGSLHSEDAIGMRQGNTPTHVGKSSPWQGWPALKKKHPHARGEVYTARSLPRSSKETPPRTWGSRWRKHDSAKYARNTPTHVGKSKSMTGLLCPIKKHPHARGEVIGSTVGAGTWKETPPRTWGSLYCVSRT